MYVMPGASSLESERPRSVSDPRILTPTLVVLLGSTPALAGLELMRHMLTLRPKDLRRVALVYIDTDVQPPAVVDFRTKHRAVPFQEFQVRIAVPTGISNVTRVPQSQQEYDDMKDPDKDPRDFLKEQHTFIEEKVPQYFSNGAGGIRNNGHVAACFNYQLIANTLDLALGRIGRLGIDQDEARIREVQVNIVAFLGGGTGSGVLADIAVMIREILAGRLYKQRINLFCLLPEPIRGVSMTDLSWRKSNATACLLELLAFSRAAAGNLKGVYEKYMRGKSHRLTNEAIANEIYLVGHSAMGDPSDTARIVGIDLFQRIADASGVGYLEHSKWVDRRTLGEADDRDLPTMFGTSCPLEVRFPAEETATAFAQISTAHLLPLLASYRPSTPRVGENEKRDWLRKWRAVARQEANLNDPLVIKLPEFRQSEFENASAGKLDTLWSRIEKYDREIEARTREIIAARSLEEIKRIAEIPRQQGDGMSVLNRRIHYLQRLQQEYELALEDLKERGVPRVQRRPVDLESRLLRQMPLIGSVIGRVRNDEGAVSEKYNERLRSFATSTRYRQMEQLLKDLLQHVGEALEQSLSWFQGTEAAERAREREATGLASMAWQGRLEYPHPHQRHLFDLRSLRHQNGTNIAVDRLYRWATVADADASSLEYGGFVSRYFEYANQSTAASDGLAAGDGLEEQTASKLADRVEEFFRSHYLERFQDVNLFDLLDKAAPSTQRGQSRPRQISGYLLEHLRHMRGLMSGLIAFEAELWHEGLSTLDMSVYLGVHWRDGAQKALLDQVLDDLGPLTDRGQAPMTDPAIDPHRLQVSYGQHAISISTIRDFYLDRNSAMEEYRMHQEEWKKTGGKGSMPVHSSGEAEKLVTVPDALGYKDSRGQYVDLVQRVIRLPY